MNRTMIAALVFAPLVSWSESRGQAPVPDVSRDAAAATTADGFLRARERLTVAAREGAMLAVLKALSEKSREDGVDADGRERLKLVADEINRERNARLLRKERLDAVRSAKDAVAAVAAAADATAKAAALATLEAALSAADAAIRADTPTRVKPDVVPADAAGKRDKGPIEETIERGARVKLKDGKEAVLDLPEGWKASDTEVEIKEDGMVVRRKPKKVEPSSRPVGDPEKEPASRPKKDEPR